MYPTLTNPLAINNAQKWFNELLKSVDPERSRVNLRFHVEVYRVDITTRPVPTRLYYQLIGFVDGLVACEFLSPALGHEFNRRLLIGFESAWMKT